MAPSTPQGGEMKTIPLMTAQNEADDDEPVFNTSVWLKQQTTPEKEANLGKRSAEEYLNEDDLSKRSKNFD